MGNNEVIISGTMAADFEFSHEVNDERFFHSWVNVRRVSNTIDVVPLMVSERMVDVTDAHMGQHVCVCGQYRTFNRHEDQKTSLVAHVFASQFNIIPEASMTDANEIFLDGFLCKEPRFRTTASGRQICDFLIAVNRNFGKSDYIPCICWGRNAIFTSKLVVGDRIQLMGRIQSRQYTKIIDDIENVRTAYEISAFRIERMDD